MILELADIRIHPGQQTAFDEAIERGVRTVIAHAKGFQGYQVFKGIEARGALEIAKRALQTCGQILRYAVAHGLIERNPAADVRPADALKPQKKENYARLDASSLSDLALDDGSQACQMLKNDSSNTSIGRSGSNLLIF